MDVKGAGTSLDIEVIYSFYNNYTTASSLQLAESQRPHQGMDPISQRLEPRPNIGNLMFESARRILA